MESKEMAVTPDTVLKKENTTPDFAEPQADGAESAPASGTEEKKSVTAKKNDKAPANTKGKKNVKGAKNGFPPKKRKKKSTSRMLIDLLIKLGVIVMLVWLVMTFVLSLTIQYGNSMHPAVRDGDLVISLRMQRPYINSAVIYVHDGEKCVGRVIGLPGNEINISDNGMITVNGITPSEEVFYPTYKADGSAVTYPYTVGDDEVFILNDFRTDTYDSRAFGAVSMKDVQGTLLLTMRRREF